MPTLTAIEIPATQVTVKDTLIFNGVSHTVADIDRKPVWIYISYIGGTKPLRIKSDDVVTVERMIKSDEEKAIEKRAAFNRMIANATAQADADFADATAKIVEDPSHWTMTKIVEARKNQELYALVARVAAHEEVDLVAAMETVRARLIEELLDANFAGCSSSVISNAIDAVRLSTTQKFVKFHAGW